MQSKKFFLVAAMALLLSANIAAQSPANGSINGHEFVDLGLSVKWATCNVGANSPEDYGDYFAWGEAKTKKEYWTDNSETFMTDDYTFHDAAKENWGSKWFMPTKEIFQQLIDNCKFKKTTINGHVGYKVTSKINGNSIFLPCAGYFAKELSSDAIMYWTSSPVENDNKTAWRFAIDDKGKANLAQLLAFRYFGKSIRPVLAE